MSTQTKEAAAQRERGAQIPGPAVEGEEQEPANADTEKTGQTNDQVHVRRRGRVPMRTPDDDDSDPDDDDDDDEPPEDFRSTSSARTSEIQRLLQQTKQT